MGKVGVLAAFGVLFFSAGVYWKMCEDAFTLYMAKYVYDTADPSWLASDMLWHAWPYVIMAIGILCLVSSGLISRGNKQVVYE